MATVMGIEVKKCERRVSQTELCMNGVAQPMANSSDMVFGRNFSLKFIYLGLLIWISGRVTESELYLNGSSNSWSFPSETRPGIWTA